MSLKMAEQDWTVALEIFRACLASRGAKAKDDRLFLEALHYHLARPAGAVWKLELGVDALRPVEQSRRVRRTSSPCWRA